MEINVPLCGVWKEVLWQSFILTWLPYKFSYLKRSLGQHPQAWAPDQAWLQLCNRGRVVSGGRIKFHGEKQLMNDSLTDPVEEKRLWLAASKTSFPPRKVERLAVEEQEEEEERAEERSLLARVGYILICWRATGGAWSGAVWADGQDGRLHGCLSRWQPPSLANQVTKPRDPRETRQPEKQEQDTSTESLSKATMNFHNLQD